MLQTVAARKGSWQATLVSWLPVCWHSIWGSGCDSIWGSGCASILSKLGQGKLHEALVWHQAGGQPTHLSSDQQLAIFQQAGPKLVQNKSQKSKIRPLTKNVYTSRFSTTVNPKLYNTHIYHFQISESFNLDFCRLLGPGVGEIIN
jgi:hypothetical protein